MSLGEDLMKPSAMLYRNLLAIEIEEMIRSNPLDGIVLLAGCDKTVPGAIMGAVSADLPMVVVTSGSREPATFRGRRLGTGSDLWRLWEERRGGPAGRRRVAGTGALPRLRHRDLQHHGHRLDHGGHVRDARPDGARLGHHPGRRSARRGRGADGRRRGGRGGAGAAARPSAILTPAAFRNAIRMLHAIGGSTNAVIHLAAIASAAGVPLPLAEFGRLGQGVPVLADVEPSGTGLLPDLDAAGGVPALLRELGGLVDGEAAWVTGTTPAPWPRRSARLGGDQVHGRGIGKEQRFRRGQRLACADGAVVKTSAATPALLRRATSMVFHGYDEIATGSSTRRCR